MFIFWRVFFVFFGDLWKLEMAGDGATLKVEWNPSQDYD